MDRREEVARAAMRERRGAELARYDADRAQADLNTIDSPRQDLRTAYDLMAVHTEDDREPFRDSAERQLGRIDLAEASRRRRQEVWLDPACHRSAQQLRDVGGWCDERDSA